MSRPLRQCICTFPCTSQQRESELETFFIAEGNQTPALVPAMQGVTSWLQCARLSPLHGSGQGSNSWQGARVLAHVDSRGCVSGGECVQSCSMPSSPFVCSMSPECERGEAPAVILEPDPHLSDSNPQIPLINSPAAGVVNSLGLDGELAHGEVGGLLLALNSQLGCVGGAQLSPERARGLAADVQRLVHLLQIRTHRAVNLQYVLATVCLRCTHTHARAHTHTHPGIHRLKTHTK